MNSIYEYSDVCMHNSYTTKCVTPRNKQYFLLSSEEEMGASREHKGVVGVDAKDLNDQQITMHFIFRCIQVNLYLPPTCENNMSFTLKISTWAESFLTRAQILPERKITRKS